jgi:hypothetical protein
VGKRKRQSKDSDAITVADLKKSKSSRRAVGGKRQSHGPDARTVVDVKL